MTGRLERGFGAIAAILVLVILGGLAAAIVGFPAASRWPRRNIQSTRARLAAYAGTEWGLARALRANDCSTGPGAIRIMRTCG